MAEFTHRTQVLLDDPTHKWLRLSAESSGKSVGEFVRSILRKEQDEELERRRRAFKKLMQFEEVEVPEDPRELKRQFAEERFKRLYDE